MFRRIVSDGSINPAGTTIDRVHLHEMLNTVAFVGQRRQVYTRLVALSGAQPGSRVLDVGCSGGYLVRLLAAAVAPDGQVTGVDPSSAAIDHARRRSPDNCSFVVGAAQDLDLPDRSFDIVISTLAVHHVPEAARQAAFREMYRVTRPGGRLLVADFRPTGRRHLLHPASHAMRHNNVDLLDDMATTAGFRLETRGDLPKLRYVRAVRPEAAR